VTDREDKKRSMLRQDPRLALALEANLRCVDWKNAERIATINVSRGGMYLRTDRHVDVGAPVQVILQLPDDTELEIGAIVRHVTRPEDADKGRPAGVGIQILPEYRNELKALLEIARLRQGKSPRPTIEVPGLAPDVAPTEAKRPDAPVGAPEPARRRARPSVEMAPVEPVQAEPEAPRVTRVLGIDFGVTYSSATLAMGESVDALADDQGRWKIPSVIVYPGRAAKPLVGWAAREVQAIRPDLALASIKRLLGRRYSDPHVAGLLHTSSFFASEGPADSILLRCGGQELAVPQLCALVLRHVADLAGEQLDGQAARAVLTHPVSFEPAQKEALQRAAQIAGIEVVGLLEEPVASALAYNAARDSDEIVAVYDFGGGTFDFTVLEMRGTQYRVLGSQGDAWLGGDDFDTVLAEAVANGFWRKTQVELRDRVVEWQRLLLACEQTKCALSSHEAADFELEQIQVSGGTVSIKQVIERSAFERISHKLFQQSIDLCQTVLQAAGLAPSSVNQVLLTGGTSRIPFIRQGLERFFGRELPEVVDPEAAVALGAGVHAASLEG